MKDLLTVISTNLIRFVLVHVDYSLLSMIDLPVVIFNESRISKLRLEIVFCNSKRQFSREFYLDLLNKISKKLNHEYVI